MLRQLIDALRHALFTFTLVAGAVLIYHVFALRGRDLDWLPEPGWSIRKLLPRSERVNDFDYAFANPDFSYTIEELPDGRFERRLKNNNWRPCLFTAYEFEGWEYELTAENVFPYAMRYEIGTTRGSRAMTSGYGFSCGTGLGQTLIRPYEGFVDTVALEDLHLNFSVYDFVREVDGEMVDRLSGQVYKGSDGDPDYGELVRLMPDDTLRIRFQLPVSNWTDLRPSMVSSNEIVVNRRAITDTFRRRY